MIECPSCLSQNPDDYSYCDQCGTRLEVKASEKVPTGIECENCHHISPSIARFCELCGNNLYESGARKKLDLDVKTVIDVKDGLEQAVYISGSFVSLDDSIQVDFPDGRKELSVGREDPVSGIYPEIDLGVFGGHEAGVGRVHAKLYLKNGDLHLEDQGSTNGTWLNDIKLIKNDPVTLSDGDQIQFAKLLLKFKS